jgi:hypothetical protein
MQPRAAVGEHNVQCHHETMSFVPCTIDPIPPDSSERNPPTVDRTVDGYIHSC